MRKKRLPLVILLSIPVFLCMLYLFISNIAKEPEIRIEYVLPDEPMKEVIKRRTRYNKSHVQTTEFGEWHNSGEEQKEPTDEKERDIQDINASQVEAEGNSPIEEFLNESAQEVILLEESIAKLKRDRKSALAIYQDTVDAILKYGTRKNELLGEDTYLELSGLEEDSPQRAAILQELSEIALKSEELVTQKEEVKLSLAEINQELPTLETRLKALLETPWAVDNIEF